jgi:hypothetical protein
MQKMVGPVAKREAVAHLKDQYQMSERRACKLNKADRKMALRERLRSIANQRCRFGYGGLFIMLRSEGEPSGNTTASIGCTAKSGLACVQPSLSRQDLMQDGHSTSCMTRWPMAGGSVS